MVAKWYISPLTWLLVLQSLALHKMKTFKCVSNFCELADKLSQPLSESWVDGHFVRKSFLRYKWKSIRYQLKSFCSKRKLEKNIPTSLFIFASHRTAIKQKNAIPEGEKLCLSGDLRRAFSAS